jgi:hypothetical protein
LHEIGGSGGIPVQEEASTPQRKSKPSCLSPKKKREQETLLAKAVEAPENPKEEEKTLYQKAEVLNQKNQPLPTRREEPNPQSMLTRILRLPEPILDVSQPNHLKQDPNKNRLRTITP